MGCASGGNLIPLAIQFPDSHYVGIDYSQDQIEAAAKTVTELGLKNIEFIAHPFNDMTTSDRFDYIICHGVYSWVNDDVRDCILDICRTHLVKNGLAVISYNTLPGWNMVRSLREMMLFHAQHFEDPAEKASQALHLLRFIRDNNPEGSVYWNVVENEIILCEQSASHISHDHLETENRPFYFHEFVEALGRHGLQYVGDTAISQMYADNLPGDAAEKLKAVTDFLRQEQYMDFIRNRRFRSSIICPEFITVNRNLRRDMIHGFYLSSLLKPDESDTEIGATDMRFLDRNGDVAFTTHTKESAVLLRQLAESPRPIKSEDLIDKAVKHLDGADRDALRATLEEIGLYLALKGLITLNAEAGGHVSHLSHVSETPEVYRLARHQAPTQDWVTNVLHQRINLDSFTRILITYLDGNNTLDILIQNMIEQVDKGTLTVQLDGKDIADPDQLRRVIRQLTEIALNEFAETALLVG